MDNWLKNNTVVKVLSLILAIMLWLVVSLDTTTTPRADIPIEQVQNTYFYEAKVTPKYNSDQLVIEMLKQQIDVTLRGNKNVIQQMRNGKNIDSGHFFVELYGMKPGTHEVPVEYSGFPKDVDVEINPTVVKVKLEAKQRKEYQVIVDKLGQEADGYQTGDPIVKPKKAHVSGTTDQLEKVAFVKAFINIDKVQKPMMEQVPLRALDRNGNVVEIEIIPQTVEVQLPVTSPYITVPLTYDISKYPSEGYAIESIEQITKEVTLYGPKEIISKYNVYKGPSLDLTNTLDQASIEEKIPLAAGLLKTEPDYMTFDIQVVPSEKKEIEQVIIEVNGLSEGLQAEIITPIDGVNVELEGAPKVLNTITKEDLQAFVDVTNLPPGKHEVSIQYNVPIITKVISNEVRAEVEITKE